MQVPSPRNRYVAEVLNRAGFATLLLDLLTLEEERVDQQTLHLRFDLPFLAEMLVIFPEGRIVEDTDEVQSIQSELTYLGR